MPHKKKKFIDKKNAVTFHLVHRGQRDPLQASEDASERVLMPATEKEAARREEQRKFGVFFEDDYDYLQHLKDVNEINEVEPIEDKFTLRGRNVRQERDAPTEGPSKLNLPSSVFGSELETDVGMLNLAAPSSGPKLDWDPDIVAALDDDFNYDDPDNILDDDFIMAANKEVDDGTENDQRVYSGSDDVGSDDDYLPSDEADMSDNDADGFSFNEEETKTRFTNYSMTSSVIRRNEGLTLLDDRFEKLYEEYDDEEIGALDHEEIDGKIQPESQILTSMLDEFEKDQQKVNLKDMIIKTQDVEVESEDSDNLEDDLVKMVIRGPEEKWDCESILSTYSTLYNHPTLIKEPKKPKKIQVDPSTGLPITSNSSQGLTAKDIQRSFTEKDSADKACTYRPKDETTEERKARKKALKEERKERRAEKKATKQAFKEEHIKQQKELINAKRTECVRMT